MEDLSIKHEKGTVEATTSMTRGQLDKLPTFKESNVG